MSEVEDQHALRKVASIYSTGIVVLGLTLLFCSAFLYQGMTINSEIGFNSLHVVIIIGSSWYTGLAMIILQLIHQLEVGLAAMTPKGVKAAQLENLFIRGPQSLFAFMRKASGKSSFNYLRLISLVMFVSNLIPLALRWQDIDTQQPDGTCNALNWQEATLPSIPSSAILGYLSGLAEFATLETMGSAIPDGRYCAVYGVWPTVDIKNEDSMTGQGLIACMKTTCQLESNWVAGSNSTEWILTSSTGNQIQAFDDDENMRTNHTAERTDSGFMSHMLFSTPKRFSAESMTSYNPSELLTGLQCDSNIELYAGLITGKYTVDSGGINTLHKSFVAEIESLSLLDAGNMTVAQNLEIQILDTVGFGGFLPALQGDSINNLWWGMVDDDGNVEEPRGAYGFDMLMSMVHHLAAQSSSLSDNEVCLHKGPRGQLYVWMNGQGLALTYGIVFAVALMLLGFYLSHYRKVRGMDNKSYSAAIKTAMSPLVMASVVNRNSEAAEMLLGEKDVDSGVMSSKVGGLNINYHGNSPKSITKTSTV